MNNLVQSALPIGDGADMEDARAVVDAAMAMLCSLRDNLDVRILLAAQRIAACKGRLVISGIGKSGIAARKIASTCASLGTPALFLHPTDAVHGDLGKMVEGDLLLCISVSGESSELVAMITHARHLQVACMAITAHELSPVARLADIVLRLPKADEGGPIPIVPMASTIATIVLGDALATLASKLKAFSSHQLAILHPAGRIGKVLKPLQSIMHAGPRIPIVPSNAGIAAIVDEIGAKGFGVTAVVDAENGELLGAISDGDLRRHFAESTAITALELMTPNPQTLVASDSVEAALEILRNYRIGAIFVTGPDHKQLVGIMHVQDLLRIGLM